MATIKDLKEALAANKARWTVHSKLLDHMEIPQFHTGGLEEGLILSEKAKRIDFKAMSEVIVNNPFILRRRIAHGILPEKVLTEHLKIGSSAMQPAGGGGEPAPDAGGPSPGGALPATVDWRNRWGWPWITTIRDQHGCEACWCFSAVALVEAMVRIEHCVWPSISEADVHKGMGRHCCDCGGAGGALDWIKDHAAADFGCFDCSWSGTGCSGCGGTGGGTYDGVSYTPTPDRSGRSVRIPAYSNVGSVEDQKKWIDTVGPLITWFEVYQDFGGLGNGIYHKLPTIGGHPNQMRGTHFMLVVGYDDNDECWIVKNSWGTGWGDNGFGRIAYGEAGIDKYAKIGLQKTNPDPWTKRRLHGGGMLESGNGAVHRNFELLATAPGGKIRHWWRDNSVSGFPWHAVSATFGDDAAVCPTLISTTFNRNFESVHLTTQGRLHHWWYGQSDHRWNDGGVFGPTDAAGIPGFIQGNYGAPGNFEVVVRTADGKLNHWWRGGGHWNDGVRFGSNVRFSGASLIQSHYGNKGNFELVCVLDDCRMQHWWRDNDHGMVWRETVTFGSGVESPPCMIEGQYGARDENSVGNFELCVVVGGQIQHWWRDNHGGGGWRHSATFGSHAQAVVSLVEGSFGFNLELVVLRTDQKLQHYWRDGRGWHEGPTFGSI